MSRRKLEIGLTSTGGAINVGATFDCSKARARFVSIATQGKTYRLILGDHSLIWPGHQTDDTSPVYAELRKLLERGTLLGTVTLGDDVLLSRRSSVSRRAVKGASAAAAGGDATHARVKVPICRACSPRLFPWPGFNDRPKLVHADWSGNNTGKRWCAVASWSEDHYDIASPQPITADATTWLTQQLESPSVVLGFDFVIGVPGAFPGGSDFAAFVLKAPPAFFDKASDIELVSPERPFFSGKGEKNEMTKRILPSEQPEWEALLRACDRKRCYRGAAEVLFWCKFSKQVGSAAIHGWQNIVRPAKKRGVALWPFDGADLRELVRRRRQVILETYPGDAYSVLGVGGNSKTSREWRRDACARIQEVLRGKAISLNSDLKKRFTDGFGPDGEDPFDATVGAILLALVALGERAPGLPQDQVVQRKEGWILGCD